MPKKIREDIMLCCERNLTNPVLKDGMAKLIAFSQEIKMKPSWVDTTREGYGRYSCKYKGKRVSYYSIENDRVLITITLAEPDMKDDLKEFYLTMPDELKKAFALSVYRHCSSNGPIRCASCTSSVTLEHDGKEYAHCTRFNFIFSPTSPKDFDIIEQCINLRRKYITTQL
jgi:hypothetical protein